MRNLPNRLPGRGVALALHIVNDGLLGLGTECAGVLRDSVEREGHLHEESWVVPDSGASRFSRHDGFVMLYFVKCMVR